MRRWGLALADSVGVLLAIAITFLAGKLTGENVFWALLVIPTWIFVAKLYNLYDRDDRRIRHSTIEEIPSLLATGAITVVLDKALSELLPLPHFSSASMIMIGGLSVVLAYSARCLVRLMYASLSTAERTVLVGSGPQAGLVSRRLQTQGDESIDLVGYIARSANGSHQGPAEHGIPYLGPVEILFQIFESDQITRVVITDDALDTRELADMIDACHNAQVAVTFVPAFQEVLGPGTELNRVGEVPMLDFHFSVPPRSTLAIKRVMDILFSGGLLVLASPILLASAILVKLDSRGPVFFRQVRVGKDGENFHIYKLRTMVCNAEQLDNRLDELVRLNSLESAAKLKGPEDPRITRVGKLLRRSSIDEIPQFFNVLKGDMSLVGPRPEIPSVVATYDERQRERLSVKPGVTGPMQIAGRGILTFEERVALERDYLDNLTVANDISILLHTPKAVLKGDGAF